VPAKTKIPDGGIQFGVPLLRELPQRPDDVLEAIYAAFGIAWYDMAGVGPVRLGLGRGGDVARTCPSPASAQRSAGSGDCWL
jgi:predicted RNA polymerase sigma factor